MSKPTIYLIAGCNGAGKTTFAREFLLKEAGCANFLNADYLALGLSPLSPEAAAIKAGRAPLRVQSTRRTKGNIRAGKHVEREDLPAASA